MNEETLKEKIQAVLSQYYLEESPPEDALDDIADIINKTNSNEIKEK